MTIENVESEATGIVWKIVSGVGKSVEEDDDLLILESMKMEIPICAPCDGVVKEIRVAEGDSVAEGDVVVVIEAC
jgi:biotin carboxyl carrier protein